MIFITLLPDVIPLHKYTKKILLAIKISMLQKFFYILSKCMKQQIYVQNISFEGLSKNSKLVLKNYRNIMKLQTGCIIL